MSDVRRRRATPEELAQGEAEMKKAQERMSREAIERGEKPLEDLNRQEGDQSEKEAQGSRSVEAPKSEQKQIQDVGKTSKAVTPAVSPVSQIPTSQPPSKSPEEFAQDQAVTPATKGHQVSPMLQDAGHGQHQQDSGRDQRESSRAHQDPNESPSKIGDSSFPNSGVPPVMQTPLFTEEQVAQLVRLQNQAAWLYGGHGMGFTPHLARPAFLPAEEEVGLPPLRNRQYQERIETEETRRNMEVVLEENRTLKERLAFLESKFSEEPRFLTPESQKGRFDEPPKKKEAADPRFVQAETTKAKEDGLERQQALKEAADPRSFQAETTKDKEDGLERQQALKEAGDPQRQAEELRSFGEASTRRPTTRSEEKEEAEGPRHHKGATDGGLTEKSLEFMAMMLESMKEMHKKVIDQKEEAGTVRGVEVVRSGVLELPPLPPCNATQGPLQLGDWLLMVEPVAADMSTTSQEWWTLMTKKVEKWYHCHMSLNPLDKITHDAVAPSSLCQERWLRLERRMSTMLLQAVPETVREELVAGRKAGVFSILSHLFLTYCPGGVLEKQMLLRNLEDPPEVTNVGDAPAALRRWLRWKSRTVEIGAVVPDAALLLKGLNRMTRRVLESHKELQFRIQLARSSLGVDTTPTELTVSRFATHLLAELDQVALTEKRISASATKTDGPKLKSMEVDKSGKGKGKDRQDRGQEDGATKTRCRFFLTEHGCRKGKECSFSHDQKDEKRRCYVCGSSEHFATACTRPKGSSSGGEGSPPKQKQLKSDEKHERKDSDSVSTSSQETAMKDLIDEANKVLKSLNPTSSPPSAQSSGMSSQEADVRSKVMDKLQQQLQAMRLKTFKLQRISTSSVLGLIDSGATHPLRPLREGENDSTYTEVEVALANGATTRLKMSPGGAMISPNENIEPIVPMGLLAEVLSCDIRWKDGSLQVLHPNRGELPVSSSERCPQVPRRLALELIREMEDAKVGVPQFAEGFEAEVSWMRSLLESHPVLSGLPSWIKKRLIVQPGEWSDLPVNRRLRKTMRREGFAVHLFAGEESGFTLSRALQQLGARDGWLLELDVLRGESHDLLKDRGCYSGLLRSALEGKLKAIVGGPNCRTRSILRHRPIKGRPDAPRPIREWGGGEFGKEDITEAEAKILEEDDVLLWRMVFLYMVAHYVAKARGMDQPAHFSLEQPASPKAYNQEVVSFWDTTEWKELKKEFGFCEETFEQSRLGGLATKPTTFGGTLELDVESHQRRRGKEVGKITDSKQLSRWAPGVMSMVASALLSQVFNKTPKICELSWAEHIAFGHIPHRRDCRVCQESQQISDQHRRIQHPFGATLSVDVAGPLKKAYDKGGGQARYMLVGAMT